MAALLVERSYLTLPGARWRPVEPASLMLIGWWARLRATKVSIYLLGGGALVEPSPLLNSRAPKGPLLISRACLRILISRAFVPHPAGPHHRNSE